MVEVLDLRQFRSAALEPLLRAEAAEWSRVLDWDYSASADLIRQYVEARILNGYVLADRVRGRLQPFGYGFFIYEAHKAMIGSIFVAEARRDSARSQERELLRHMLATMQATPTLERIEAQLMPFAPQALAAGFAETDFASYRRVFLELGLGGPAPPAPEAPA
ncbi:MAG: GNAT family N-acetyltransferase, partial [Terriglobales bacterium]